MLSSHRPSWRDPRVLSTLSMVFLAGALTGALTMRVGLHDRLHGGELSYQQLKSELSLTPDQADKIKLILDDFVKYNQDIETQVEDVRATGKNQIKAVLNEEQKRRFEKICKQAQNR